VRVPVALQIVDVVTVVPIGQMQFGAYHLWRE
jgi:hypothetical protein